MLQIPRSLIRQVRSVCRRAGIKPQKHLETFVQILAGPEGLTIRAWSTDIALTYREVTELPAFTALVPLAILAECEGRRADVVTFDLQSDGTVTAAWREGNVPQQRSWKPAEENSFDRFPETPSSLTENSPVLLTALADASDTADANAGRYALGCVQLRGEQGVVVGTDGRQLLWQGGFSFPWSESLLIPPIHVLAAPDFLQSEPVHIGRDADWVFILSGSWTIGLRIEKDARYPAVEQVIPRNAPATTLYISQSDRKFLADAIARLPGAEETNAPVTLDLNGEVAVRASANDQSVPTELVLSGSRLEGRPLRMNVNRTFLRRAMQLGFETLGMSDDDSTVLCDSGPCSFPRKYIFMPLSKDSPVLSAPNALRTVSPADAGDPRFPPSIHISHTTMPTTTTPTETNNATATTTQASNDQKRAKKPASSLDQAVALRTALRESAAKANELVKALKREQRQQRIVKETLRSLKQLQAA